MSQLSQANAKKRTPSQWLSLALISAVFGALLLVMLSGTVSAQSSDPIGRGFTGVATINDGEASLTVESKGEVFTLTITDDTVIHNLPDHNVELNELPEGDFRIAGLVDRAVTDSEGNVTAENITAQKIVVIPAKATRRHHRTIAVDNEDGDLTTLDEDGVTDVHPGRGAGFKKGDAVVLLVQESGKGGIGKRVRGLFRSDSVDARLERLALSEAHDEEKAAFLAELHAKRDEAQAARLLRTADNSGTRFSDFVHSLRDSLLATVDGEESGGIGRMVSECARSRRGPALTDQCEGTTDGVSQGADLELDVDLDGFTVADGDCNDDDASIHPDATDAVDDGIDQDCDGVEASADVDGDNVTVAAGDCNDNEATIYPGALEVLDDGIDQDCDGVDTSASDDVDLDTITVGAGDCNDHYANIYPGAPEVLDDGIDQDCNGADASADVDEDTFTVAAGDCNDNDASIHPDATDAVDDGIDQDCDGVEASADVDGDNVTVAAGDCNDNEATIYPGATEVLDDGIDQDCDGVDASADVDEDGVTVAENDCDDTDATIYPGATDTPGDGIDQDCDGSDAT